MLRNRKILTTLFILTIGAYGCRLLSNKSNEAEAVFAATEVGTPDGEKVTKEIGPAGGTVASADGRLTLTIPQNTVAETTSFSIQPITNNAGGGLGLAYRLEPNGKTFVTPLQITIKYDEASLEGTIPEAFSLAYQDPQGAWHAQKLAKLDQSAKTLTISTHHFTDFAFLARLRLSPTEAKLYPGGSLGFELLECREPGLLDRLLSRPLVCAKSPHGRTNWKLRGAGTIGNPHSDETGVLYTAPDRKPADNIVFLDLTIDFYLWNSETGATSVVQRTFSARITIIDRGYRATGRTADAVYSGVVCRLDDPFDVTVTTPLFTYPLKLVPNGGRGTTGTMSFAARVSVITMTGTGSYTIEGFDTDKPRLAVKADSTGQTPIGSRSGGGTLYIDLVPLETDECNTQ